MGPSAVTVLTDHDIEGYAELLWGTLASSGWLDLYPIKLLTFADVGLSIDSTDRDVWRYAQANHLILLTNNRNIKDAESLENTLREENSPTSLPVLTIGNLSLLSQKPYRERCADRLIEIALNLEHLMGTGRIYIP